MWTKKKKEVFNIKNNVASLFYTYTNVSDTLNSISRVYFMLNISPSESAVKSLEKQGYCPSFLCLQLVEVVYKDSI